MNGKVIIKTVERKGTKVIALADDGVVLMSGKFQLLSGGITLLELASRAWPKGISISPRKTEMLPFTSRCKVPDLKKNRTGSTETEARGTHMQHLGRILDMDSKLARKLSMEARIESASKASYTCNKMFGRKSSLVTRSLLRHYEANLAIWGLSLVACD